MEQASGRSVSCEAREEAPPPPMSTFSSSNTSTWLKKPARKSVARMCRVATSMSLRIASESGGHVSSSWITHLGIDSWNGRMKSANARSRYVRKESVLTCAAMKSVPTRRERCCATASAGCCGRSASVWTISGMRLGMVVWMYRG